MFIAFFSGCFTWSLTEYIFHRFAGHRRTGLNFSEDHLQHHRDPTSFVGWSYKATRALKAYGLLALLVTPFAGLLIGLLYALGFVVAYGYYEWLHIAIHAHGPRNRYGRWARRHHFYHHFGDMRMNHGVTSPVWDMVFGTYVPAAVVKIPRKKADSWLKTAVDTASSENWLEDYRLITAANAGSARVG
jgi:sterol desaturase/sphingolipid hydroxylase (fatty acid hydroxylase superfamily)